LFATLFVLLGFFYGEINWTTPNYACKDKRVKRIMIIQPCRDLRVHLLAHRNPESQRYTEPPPEAFQLDANLCVGRWGWISCWETRGSHLQLLAISALEDEGYVSRWNLYFMLRRKPQHTRIDGWPLLNTFWGHWFKYLNELLLPNTSRCYD